MPTEIPVVIDPGPEQRIPSMNVEPILHEVQYAIEKLLKSGETSMIDLRAMPLAPGEDELIRQRLGTGEAIIHIEALGPSVLTETAYPGVWWVEHRNSEDAVTGLYIEIAHVPSIVFPANEDIEHGLDALTEDLKSNDHLNGKE